MKENFLPLFIDEFRLHRRCGKVNKRVYSWHLSTHRLRGIICCRLPDRKDLPEMDIPKERVLTTWLGTRQIIFHIFTYIKSVSDMLQKDISKHSSVALFCLCRCHIYSLCWEPLQLRKTEKMKPIIIKQDWMPNSASHLYWNQSAACPSFNLYRISST